MDEILGAAAQLGKLIAQHEIFRRLRSVEAAVRAEPETQKLLKDFEAQRRKIEDLEAAQRPVEPDDKREMKRLSDAVHANGKLQELMRAQADYMAFMNKMNRAIRAELGPSEQARNTES